MQRDGIDFGNMNLGRLFRKQLVPTMAGMVFSALFVITDGIFVGRGIGSDALAAVNVIAPLFSLSTAFGLMFGMGGAVVASINLSRGKERIAGINATQAVTVSGGLMLLASLIIFMFPAATARVLGATDEILPLAVEYLLAFLPFTVFHTLLNLLNFFTRIDGPKVAMMCMTTATLINIFLDYLFIFPFGWGLTGAAVATGIGEMTGCVMMIVYLVRSSPRVRLGRLKISRKSLLLTARNSGYMVRLGCPAFLNQIAIGIMMLTGNFMFAEYVGTPGIAAFSVVCYLFPIIFMVFDSVTQSAQPIVSFNHGAGYSARVRATLRISLFTALLLGLVFLSCGQWFNDTAVSLFITDRSNPAHALATQGLKYFSLGFPFFGLNVVSVGFLMSIEKAGRAMFFTIIRGIVFPVMCFFILPLQLGISGIWLAVPAAELLTTAALALSLMGRKAPKDDRLSRTVA